MGGTGDDAKLEGAESQQGRESSTAGEGRERMIQLVYRKRASLGRRVRKNESQVEKRTRGKNTQKVPGGVKVLTTNH